MATTVHATVLAHQNHVKEILETINVDVNVNAAVVLKKDHFHLLDLHSADQDLNLAMQQKIVAVMMKGMMTVDAAVMHLLQNLVMQTVVAVMMKDPFHLLDLDSADQDQNLVMQTVVNSKDLFLLLDLQSDVDVIVTVVVTVTVTVTVVVTVTVIKLLIEKQNIITNIAINTNTAHANLILGDAIQVLGIKKDILEDVQNNFQH